MVLTIWLRLITIYKGLEHFDDVIDVMDGAGTTANEKFNFDWHFWLK